MCGPYAVFAMRCASVVDVAAARVPLSRDTLTPFLLSFPFLLLVWRRLSLSSLLSPLTPVFRHFSSLTLSLSHPFPHPQPASVCRPPSRQSRPSLSLSLSHFVREKRSLKPLSLSHSLSLLSKALHVPRNRTRLLGMLHRPCAAVVDAVVALGRAPGNIQRHRSGGGEREQNRAETEESALIELGIWDDATLVTLCLSLIA